MELIIIRHGLPLTVEKEDGSTADPELSPEGIEQAQRMAKWMEREKLDALYCSPMKRALMTAEPLSKIKNMEIQIEPGVAEIDKSASSYIPMEEIKEKHPEQWQQILEDGIEKTFNGYMDLDVFRDTVVTSVSKIINDNKGKRVAIVCHGGVINVWAAHILGIKDAMFFNPYYTSLNRFMASSSGVHSLNSLNETGHLRSDLTYG